MPCVIRHISCCPLLSLPGILKVFRLCRPPGEQRVSGRDAGLQADVDGRFLSKPRDYPQLPRGDRAPLLGVAPQRAHVALSDEGGAWREGKRSGEVPAGGEHSLFVHFSHHDSWLNCFFIIHLSCVTASDFGAGDGPRCRLPNR